MVPLVAIVKPFLPESPVAERSQMANAAIVEQGSPDKSFAGDFQFVTQGQGWNPWSCRTAQPLNEPLGMVCWGWRERRLGHAKHRRNRRRTIGSKAS